MPPFQQVSDDVVDAFRAYLAGDSQMWKARNAALDWSRDGRRAYRAFIHAMFAEAVHRRLGRHPREARIIEFVADVRALSDDIADAIDPDQTERLIASLDADAETGDIGTEASLRISLTVLAAIIGDEHLSPAELNVFLERSRTFANEILG